MINIIVKDNATIITIENPTPSEERVIKNAKDAEKLSSSNVWSKFKCNQKGSVCCDNDNSVSSVPENFIDLSDFEEILCDDEIPF